MNTVDGSRDWSWRFRGNCYRARTEDPEAYESFFGNKPTQRRPALKMCDGCPVKKECLLEALEESQIWGVWGGTDESDIRRSLWVDSTSKIGRNVVPKCPWCKTSKETLKISDAESRTIVCADCDFSWVSETTYVGLRFYEEFQTTGLGEIIGFSFYKDLISRESMQDEQFDNINKSKTDDGDQTQTEAHGVVVVRVPKGRIPSERPQTQARAKPQSTPLPEAPLGLAASFDPDTNE